MTDFDHEVARRLLLNSADAALNESAEAFMNASLKAQYSYNFSWLGRPIIQYPQDMAVMQELIWRTRPDLIVETGIAHGGSIVMSASMLALLDYCDAVRDGRTLDPRESRRKVVAVDIDIRSHNRAAIESHPLAHKIEMIQGSSVSAGTIAEVHERSRDYDRVLVCLDSNHTHEHVLAELEAYAPLTSLHSYCVVFDTIIEDAPADLIVNRPWSSGNSPKTAMREYLERLQGEGRTGKDGRPLMFAIDHSIENKVLITVAPDGYLRRV